MPDSDGSGGGADGGVGGATGSTLMASGHRSPRVRRVRILQQVHRRPIM